MARRTQLLCVSCKWDESHDLVTTTGVATTLCGQGRHDDYHKAGQAESPSKTLIRGLIQMNNNKKSRLVSVRNLPPGNYKLYTPPASTSSDCSRTVPGRPALVLWCDFRCYLLELVIQMRKWKMSYVSPPSCLPCCPTRLLLSTPSPLCSWQLGSETYKNPDDLQSCCFLGLWRARSL